MLTFVLLGVFIRVVRDHEGLEAWGLGLGEGKGDNQEKGIEGFFMSEPTLTDIVQQLQEFKQTTEVQFQDLNRKVDALS